MRSIKSLSKSGDVDFVRLKTSRLTLRRLKPDDAVRISRYRSKPEVARYQSWTRYPELEAKRLIRQMSRRDPGKAGQWFQFAIELQEDNKSTPSLIGDCALHVSTADPTQAEIGFTLDSRHQGRGYATEAVAALVDYCFKRLRLRRITATTDALNAGAARLLRRLQFRQEAHLIENLLFKGKWGSEFQFAILAKEWRVD